MAAENHARKPWTLVVFSIMADKIEIESLINSTSWNHDNLDTTLKQLFRYCDDVARIALRSYWQGSLTVARTLRVLAVLCLTAGSICPLIKLLLLPDQLSKLRFDVSQLGYVFLAIAGALVAIDRYLGFSSISSRKTLTRTAINKAREDFKLDWMSIVVKWDGERPKTAQVEPLLNLCKEFNSKIQKLIGEATIAVDEESRKLRDELETRAQDSLPKHSK
jgi:hypothetical protein